ncbi:Major facilitator superfamily domain,Major facilitator superfamily associated domain [Cinara cedri]|uniref:Major facilitator superfamily domain,Major facilitator superfamily associated domain n=1 Tax=Cinara cedri TaxID=506608 RepID=A0A5E4N1I6_9HEMI|nr:Major facilitator superfamily domain,Major facilitator superfamily associated domain [Cinara cedri]
MTFMALITIPLLPAIGVIVDKFRVKKCLVMTSLFGMSIMMFSFMYVPKLPAERVSMVELTCDWKTRNLIVRTENDQQTEGNQTFYIQNVVNDVLATCKLLECRTLRSVNYDINDHKGHRVNTRRQFGSIGHLNSYDRVDVAFKLKDVKHVNNSNVFHLTSVHVNEKETPSIACSPWNFPTYRCVIQCSNKNAMRLVAMSTAYGRRNILGLYQFWIFFTVITLFWIFLMTTVSLQNPICLDMLDNKPEDFGKQRCWSSVGWGVFSILIGWLVDVFSVGKKEKDYSPVFYSGITLTIVNLYVVSKLQVFETKKSKGKWKCVRGLFTKYSVIVFYAWTTFNTFFYTIINNFLFWYMEEQAKVNNDRNHLLKWIKTLQGLVQGVQCLGGEIPFFFWSGWIIKNAGHANCMALTLGCMAIKMYLYTVVPNPTWIVLVELLNGLSYALGFAMKMSYAKLIAPPGTLCTVVGLIGLVDNVGQSLGSLFGGYMFGRYGGVWSFRVFSSGAALMCSLTILTTRIFRLTEDLEKNNYIVINNDPEIQAINSWKGDDNAVVVN